MTTNQFLELKSFTVHKSQALIPNQIETGEWMEQKKHGEQVYLKSVEPRDLGMHKGYFKILGFIYDNLPANFKASVDKKNFYNFLKILSNEYKIVFEFKNGIKMIEYDSISFAKMNQTTFRNYFNNQLSVIYEELLIPLNKEYIMDEVNEMFESLLSKLI